MKEFVWSIFLLWVITFWTHWLFGWDWRVSLSVPSEQDFTVYHLGSVPEEEPMVYELDDEQEQVAI